MFQEQNLLSSKSAIENNDWPQHANCYINAVQMLLYLPENKYQISFQANLFSNLPNRYEDYNFYFTLLQAKIYSSPKLRLDDSFS